VFFGEVDPVRRQKMRYDKEGRWFHARGNNSTQTFPRAGEVQLPPHREHFKPINQADLQDVVEITLTG
jgi:hypothetical protein